MEVNHITQRVGVQSGAAFSYGLGKIYDLIIVQIAQVYCNQPTRDLLLHWAVVCKALVQSQVGLPERVDTAASQMWPLHCWL